MKESEKEAMRIAVAALRKIGADDQPFSFGDFLREDEVQLSAAAVPEEQAVSLPQEPAPLQAVQPAAVPAEQAVSLSQEPAPLQAESSAAVPAEQAVSLPQEPAPLQAESSAAVPAEQAVSLPQEPAQQQAAPPSSVFSRPSVLSLDPVSWPYLRVSLLLIRISAHTVFRRRN